MLVNKLAILEGLLFVVGDDGLNIDQLTEILEIDKEEAKNLISELKESYESDNRGITINFLGNTFKLTTKKEHKEYYQKLIENASTNMLSQSALETLAIIAYNEPITRVGVEEIRGVNSTQMVRKLVAKGFIKEIGRSDMPGRPIIYKTTDDFLDYFGLSSKEDLPKIDQVFDNTDNNNETDLFRSIYKEEQ
jgi:segregation and condensation protein B